MRFNSSSSGTPHHLDQVPAVIGDDRIEAAVLFGRVVATLRRIGSVRLQDMPKARLQLRDQRISGRREVALKEAGEPERVERGPEAVIRTATLRRSGGNAAPRSRSIGRWTH